MGPNRQERRKQDKLTVNNLVEAILKTFEEIDISLPLSTIHLEREEDEIVIISPRACESSTGNPSGSITCGTDTYLVKSCTSEVLGKQGCDWLNSDFKLVAGGRQKGKMRKQKRQGSSHSRVLARPTPFKDAATVAAPADEKKSYAVGIPLQTIPTAQASLAIGQVSFNMNTMTTFVVGGGAINNIPFFYW